MKKQATIVLPLLLSLVSCNTSLFNKYASYENASKYAPIEDIGNAYENVNTIDLDWVKGNINIYISKEYKWISVFEKTSDIIKDEFKCHLYQDRNTLNIKYCKSNISIPNEYAKTLEIYIPDTVDLSLININDVSSSITIDGIYCENLDIESVNGLTNLKNLHSKNIEFDGVNGDINIALSNYTKNLDINNVNGNSVISLPEINLGFLVEFSSVLGKFNSDFECLKQGDEYVYLSEENLKIEFDSVNGNFTIVKRKD